MGHVLEDVKVTVQEDVLADVLDVKDVLANVKDLVLENVIQHVPDRVIRHVAGDVLGHVLADAEDRVNIHADRIVHKGVELSVPDHAVVHVLPDVQDLVTNPVLQVVLLLAQEIVQGNATELIVSNSRKD